MQKEGSYYSLFLLDIITKMKYNKSVTNISPFSFYKKYPQHFDHEYLQWIFLFLSLSLTLSLPLSLFQMSVSFQGLHVVLRKPPGRPFAGWMKFHVV